MKRLVADTNVLVSAIQFGGKPKQLLDLAADGQIDLAISEAILEEMLRVLKDKFYHADAELRETDTQLRVIARTHRHAHREHQRSGRRPIGQPHSGMRRCGGCRGHPEW